MANSTVALCCHPEPAPSHYSTQIHNQRHADSPTGNNIPKTRIITASPLQFCLLPTAWTLVRKCRCGPCQGCPDDQYAKHRRQLQPCCGILAAKVGMGKCRQKDSHSLQDNIVGLRSVQLARPPASQLDHSVHRP